jgi:tRNA pseudouridine38-40 synthase
MRIALGLQYDGSGFRGWQSQREGATVQDALEAALAAIAGHSLRVNCAGRTDAGVHALGQVVHFDSEAERPLDAWVRGVNAHLPTTIAVQWAAPVPNEFHARMSALERRYVYLLQVSPVRPALLAGKIGWFHLPLDLARMREAAAHLEGPHDFSAFRAAECQAKSPQRDLREISIEARDGFFLFRFRADAFLQHMVRNIVGSLVQVGKGKRDALWVRQVLESRDRKLAAPTFAPDGLYLERVSYEARWALPEFAPSALDLLAPAHLVQTIAP